MTSSIPASGAATPGASGSPRSSTTSPAASRRLLAIVRPSTTTFPSSISDCTSLRVHPVSNATARSTRSPSNTAGTTSSSVIKVCTRDRTARTERIDNQEHRSHSDRGVGHVERRPRAEMHEVDDRAPQEPGRAEDAVAEVAERATEHERKTHDSEGLVRAPDRTHEKERHRQRDQRQERGEGTEEAECDPRVAGEPEVDGVTHDRDLTIREVAHCPQLGQLIGGDDPDDEDGGEHKPAGIPFGHGAGSPFGHGAGIPFGHRAGILTGVVRHAPCTRRRCRRTAAPPAVPARYDGQPAHTTRTSSP